VSTSRLALMRRMAAESADDPFVQRLDLAPRFAVPAQ